LTISCRPIRALRTLSWLGFQQFGGIGQPASASKPAPAQLRPSSRPCSSAGETGGRWCQQGGEGDVRGIWMGMGS
jgi:hypothetical protein